MERKVGCYLFSFVFFYLLGRFLEQKKKSLGVFLYHIAVLIFRFLYFLSLSFASNSPYLTHFARLLPLVFRVKGMGKGSEFLNVSS